MAVGPVAHLDAPDECSARVRRAADEVHQVMLPWRHVPRFSWVIGGLLACGPRASGSPGSDDADPPSGATSELESDGASATGPAVITACGPDGIAVGPIGIRTNDDAQALSGCTVVDGDLFVDPCRLCFPQLKPGCLECDDPQALTSLAGLESLQRVTGSVFVGWDGDVLGNEERTGHERLASIAELGGLREVEGDLHLGYAPLVTSPAFPVLERVGGVLLVADSFPADVAFPALRDVGRLRLIGPSRTTFAFPMLERVASTLLYGTRIVSLVGAPRLQELGRINIDGDEVLTDLSPLLGVPVSDSVSIHALPRVTALELPAAGPDTSISARNCPALERVSIPPEVEEMTSLYLVDNDSLTTLDFQGLVELPWGLGIAGNDMLSSLEGLSSLQYVDVQVGIVDNPQLCQSEVDAFVEGLQLGDEISHWTVAPNGGC